MLITVILKLGKKRRSYNFNNEIVNHGSISDWHTSAANNIQQAHANHNSGDALRSLAMISTLTLLQNAHKRIQHLLFYLSLKSILPRLILTHTLFLNGVMGRGRGRRGTMPMLFTSQHTSWCRIDRLSTFISH